MKTTIFRFSYLFFTILMIAGIMSSCKKTNEKSDLRPADISDMRAKAQEEIKRMGGVPEIIPINKRVPTRLLNKSGEEYDPKTNTNRGGGGCSNPTFPAYVDFVQYQRIYNCYTNNNAGGYKIQWEYNVSWDKTMVLTNSAGASTAGALDVIDDATGLSVYYRATTSTNIVSLGADPSNPGNTIYHVTFAYGDLGSATILQFQNNI